MIGVAPKPLSEDLAKLLEGAEHYDNNADVKIQSFMDCFNVTDDNEVVKLIEDFQKHPEELLNALKIILNNKEGRAKAFFGEKKNFFHFLIYNTLSSYYREEQCKPELYFDVLQQMKDFFETKELSEEFGTILNQLISDDYIGGQNLAWKKGSSLNVNEMRDLCITVNGKNKVSSIDDRFKIISNIFESKRVKNEAEDIADGEEREMVESIEVLPFFQNNKLLFNGNKKISSTNYQDFDGKSRVQIYFEYFGKYLSTKSIEYLLGTIGLKKGAKIIDNSQKLALMNRKKLINEKNKGDQENDKSFDGKKKSAIKNINALNKEISTIKNKESGGSVPINSDNIYIFEDNLRLKNQSGNIKIESVFRHKEFSGNYSISSPFPSSITNNNNVSSVAGPGIPPPPPLLPPPFADTSSFTKYPNDYNPSAKLASDENAIMASIDGEAENNLFKTILSADNFSSLDPTTKALKFDYSKGNINSTVEDCKKILKEDENYQIQDFLFGDLEFLKQNLNQEDMLKITGMKHFSKFRNTNDVNDVTELAGLENVEKEKLAIIENLYLIQGEFLKKFHNIGLDFSYKGNNSSIIENCKRFYFNEKLILKKENLIGDVIFFLNKNIHTNIINNRFNKQLIGNSLFGFAINPNTGESIENTKDSNIKIDNVEYAKEVIKAENEHIGNVRNKHSSRKMKSNFQRFVDETSKPIPPQVLECLIDSELISREKLAKELVTIIYNHSNNKNYYGPKYANNMEDFVEKACQYLGLENSKFDHDYDKEMIARALIEKYNTDVTKITLNDVLDKDVLENVVVAKELCSSISLVDGISSSISGTTKIKKLVRSAINTYRYVNKYGFLQPKKNDKNLDEKKQPDINNIDQLKDLVKELKQCLLSQIDGINKKIISLANEQLDNKQLNRMKELIINELSGLKEHVLAPHLNDIVPAPPKNDLIKMEFKALLEVSKRIAKDYNDFIRIYSNKDISELKKKQENLIEFTKSKLINNLEKMVTKQQKEWKDFFSNFTNQNKNEDDLENFFDENYNNINNYYNEIIKNIKQFPGNNEENLNQQVSEYVNKLKEKMKDFDEELKSACNYRSKRKQELNLVTKKEANVKNSKILTNDELESQINDIKAAKKKVNDCLKNKKTGFLKNIFPGESSLFFDNPQKLLTTFAVGDFSLGIPLALMLGGSLSIVAIPIGVGIVLFGSVFVRKVINDKYLLYKDAEIEQQIYEKTFPEEKSNQKGNYINKQKNNDNKSIFKSDKPGEKENGDKPGEKENDKQIKEIKNKINIDLKSGKTNNQQKQ